MSDTPNYFFLVKEEGIANEASGNYEDL